MVKDSPGYGLFHAWTPWTFLVTTHTASTVGGQIRNLMSLHMFRFGIDLAGYGRGMKQGRWHRWSRRHIQGLLLILGVKEGSLRKQSFNFRASFCFTDRQRGYAINGISGNYPFDIQETQDPGGAVSADSFA